MKNAKKMFEELGYKLKIDDRTVKGVLVIYYKGINTVTFKIEGKYYSNILYDVNNLNQEYINKLNSAINQQINELGWLDEEI